MRAVRVQVHALQLQQHCVYGYLNNQSKQAMGEPRAGGRRKHTAPAWCSIRRVDGRDRRHAA